MPRVVAVEEVAHAGAHARRPRRMPSSLCAAPPSPRPASGRSGRAACRRCLMRSDLLARRSRGACRPSTLMPCAAAGLPATITNGGTSCVRLVPMPMNACAPILQNWCTPAKPPRITQSPTCTWPASVRVVGEDGVVADLAVVRDVHVGHDPVVVADARDARVLRGAAVEGAELADRVAVADLEPRGLAARTSCPAARAPMRGELEDAVVAADRRVARRSRRAGRPWCPRRSRTCGADDGVRADLDVVRRAARRGSTIAVGMDRCHDCRAGCLASIVRIVHISRLRPRSRRRRVADALNFQMPRAMRSSSTSSSAGRPASTGRLKRAPSMPTK